MDEPFELAVAVRYSLVQPFFFPILFSTAYAFVEWERGIRLGGGSGWKKRERPAPTACSVGRSVGREEKEEEEAVVQYSLLLPFSQSMAVWGRRHYAKKNFSPLFLFIWIHSFSIVANWWIHIFVEWSSEFQIARSKRLRSESDKKTAGWSLKKTVRIGRASLASLASAHFAQLTLNCPAPTRRQGRQSAQTLGLVLSSETSTSRL